MNPGAQLGPYQLVSLLGSGGMGQVYRAIDRKLRREVALKMLSPDLTRDEEARLRFEHEAYAASQLNHPNIVTIFDLAEWEGVYCIAMELVDGPSLRELMRPGPMPISRVLAIGVQVADGLASAHEHGIFHRDLKPENIIVAADDRVKIVDFGLAKQGRFATTPPRTNRAAGTPAPDCSSIEPTIWTTQPGVILGTVGYMSPEQARGEAVDFRSDQFSFGAVLYELCTGRRAFDRKSMIETAAAVITDQLTPVAHHRRDVPPPLSWAVERCMAKDPKQRYAATRGLHQELQTIRERLIQTPRATSEVRSTLPTPRTPFVGREREVAAVTNLLLKDDVRWVTLTGPGGVGKTRLAVQVARGLLDQFNVQFAALGLVADERLVASAIGDALSVDFTRANEAIDAIVCMLRAQPQSVLLVVDNFEHILNAAPVLTHLIEACSHVKVLVTSRELVRVYGEHEYAVLPLPVPDQRHIRPDVLLECPSIALFVERAVAAQTGFRLSAGNAAAIASICAQLDGLPMAIELAAARIKMLTPAALSARLAGRVLSLTGGARDAPTRQQTLRGAIDWSHDLLSPQERVLFRRLGVFAGGWTVEAAEAVSNPEEDLDLDVFDGLSSLVDKSLVQRGDASLDEPRFAMLETIREYALEKLSVSDDLAVTRRAHAAYCLVLAEESASCRTPADHAAWLARCDAESANFRTALECLVETEDAEWGIRLGFALLQFWQTRGRLAEGREWLERLVVLPRAWDRPELRARGLFGVGTLAHSQREFDVASSFLREALAIYRATGDRKNIAVTVNGLGIGKLDTGDFPAALEFFGEAAAIWREIGDEQALARTVSNIANAKHMAGDPAEARRLYQECRQLFERAGDRIGYAWSLLHEADCARDQHDLGSARGLSETALSRFRAVDDNRGGATALLGLAQVAGADSDWPTAMRAYDDTLAVAARLGDPRLTSRILEAMAADAARHGDGLHALRLAGAAAAIRERLRTPLLDFERAALERALEPARRGSAAADVTSAWMDGWTMSVDEAIAYARESGRIT